MAAFTCTSRLPITLRSESTKIVSSSSSTRRIFSVLPESTGLRIRLSLSPSPLTSVRASRLRRSIVCEAQETTTTDTIPVVNDSTWDSLVIKADGPVLVDFWAPWCGPCKMIDPLVSELAQQYAGKVKFYKLNTDESPSTPSKYNVRSIPTIMVFINGEKKDTIIGAVPKKTLTSSIDKYL